MERKSLNFHGDDLNLKATELRLGLPGSEEPEKQASPSSRNNKRAYPEMAEDCRTTSKKKASLLGAGNCDQDGCPPTK